MSLNFRKGSSLCKIDGGQYNNEIVYIYDNIDDINKRDRIPFNSEIILVIKTPSREVIVRLNKVTQSSEFNCETSSAKVSSKGINLFSYSFASP